MKRGALSALARNWKEIIRTQNLAADGRLDPVSRWLLITRASVFPMTILSGLIGGSYFVTTGEAPVWVFLASLPHALLVTTVLIGKHIGKLPADAAKGIHTLPVLLGEGSSRTLNRVLMTAFYVGVVVLVAIGVLGWWTLLVLLSLPRLLETWRAFGEPRPAQPPEGYPIWPLWYVAWTFRLTRAAGSLLLLGMLLDALLPPRH